MNQHKNYQSALHAKRFFTKHITIAILLLLTFSFYSTLIIQNTSANPLAIPKDGTTEEPVVKETEDSSKPVITTTTTTPEPTQTTEPVPVNQDTTSTKEDTTLTVKDTNTPSETSVDSPEQTDDIAQGKNNSTIISNETTKLSNNIINLVDKTTEIKNILINNESTSIKNTSNIELHLEGDIGNTTKDNHITMKTSINKQNRSLITEVNFTAATDHNNVRLTVSELKEKPEDVKKEFNFSTTNKIYKYVDIKLTANDTYIGESGISKMTFTFTVEKSWIENNSLDENTIIMLRYHNETWHPLNTTYLNETEEFLYFQAETPGLSVFAVVGNTIVEESEAIVDGSIHIPMWASIGIIFSSSTLLSIVLIKKRFIYRN